MHLTILDIQFVPREPQQRFLAASVDPRVAPSVEARCRAAGISRQTYYNWLREPGFTTWLLSERHQALVGELADVIHAIVREALKGSIEHARLVLELSGQVRRGRSRGGAGVSASRG